LRAWTWIFCLIAFPSLNAFSQTSKPFTITYIEYPNIEGYAKLFEEIYTELGFETTLIPTPSLRGLRLLDQGVVDADVVRLAIAAKNHPNIIVIQPELNRANLTLFCIKGVPCTKDILTNKNITILASDSALNLFSPGEFKAQQAYTYMDWRIPKMLKADRYKYAVFVIDDLMQKQFNADFQIVKIKSIAINHFINKKHRALVPQIEEKLRKKLPVFLSNREMQKAL
jgi:hypothetical protein